MYEEDTEAGHQAQNQAVPDYAPQSHMLRNILIVVAALYMAVSLYFIFEMRGRIGTLETALKADEQSAAAHNAVITQKLGMTEASMQHETEALQNKLTEAQRESANRAAQLAVQQKQSEQRLREENEKQVGAVASEVGNVKTDVAGAKTDIASTKQDLEATKMKLEKTIGDLNIQSGLVAKNQNELEFLKHRGDRNYFEFTLKKGEHPKPVSTVSLELKKVDQKHGKFTLNVLADDRTIQKKDRNMLEPIQFYTGRDRNLYELVIFQEDKNTVSGYISTPKSAPVPVTPGN